MKHALVALVLLAVPASAQVDRERLALSDMLSDGDVEKLVGRMADPFEVRGLFFTDAACTAFNKPQKVRGAARAKLVACLVQRKPQLAAERSKNTIWIDERDADGKVYTLFELEKRAGKLASIQSAASTRAERSLPTIKRFTKVPFAVSAKTKLAIAKLPERTVGYVREPAAVTENWHKICFDETGTVKTRRVIVKSDVAAFEKETVAAVAAVNKVEPYVVEGTPRPACEIVHLSSYH